MASASASGRTARAARPRPGHSCAGRASGGYCNLRVCRRHVIRGRASGSAGTRYPCGRDASRPARGVDHLTRTGAHSIVDAGTCARPGACRVARAGSALGLPLLPLVLYRLPSRHPSRSHGPGGLRGSPATKYRRRLKTLKKRAKRKPWARIDRSGSARGGQEEGEGQDAGTRARKEYAAQRSVRRQRSHTVVQPCVAGPAAPRPPATVVSRARPSKQPSAWSRSMPSSTATRALPSGYPARLGERSQPRYQFIYAADLGQQRRAPRSRTRGKPARTDTPIADGSQRTYCHHRATGRRNQIPGTADRSNLAKVWSRMRFAEPWCVPRDCGHVEGAPRPRPSPAAAELEKASGNFLRGGRSSAAVIPAYLVEFGPRGASVPTRGLDWHYEPLVA